VLYTASFLFPAPDQHPILDAFYKYKNLCNCLDKAGRGKKKKKPKLTIKGGWGGGRKNDKCRLYSSGKSRVIAEIKMTEGRGRHQEQHLKLTNA